MIRIRSLLPLLVVTLLLAAGTSSFAGIEPMPFRAVMATRTDRLPAESPFYRTTMFDMVLTLKLTPLAGATDDVVIRFPDAVGAADLTLGPGQAASVYVNPGRYLEVAGRQIVAWSFSAKMGIDPSPFLPGVSGVEPSPSRVVFAYQAVVASQPEAAPLLPPSYLTGPMLILGFASPGVVVGTVETVNDTLFYEACPTIPAEGFAWKNHGQYVRCVSHQVDELVLGGIITTEQADAIVSAAAKSEVGK